MGSYTALYYHCVWACRQRAQMLTPDVEPVVFRYIGAKCAEVGIRVYALNGLKDHVHLVCSIPARLAVADALERIKDLSSHDVNRQMDGRHVLYW